MGRAWIGTSGYSYPHWRGGFFPADLPARRWLDYYAARFPTVEINQSFYQLPSGTAFRDWAEQVPPGFVFSLQGSRYVTHIKRLKDCRAHVARLLEASRPLWEQLRVVLWRLPASFAPDPARLDRFLADASAVAPHDGVRFAVEFRDPRWLRDDVYEVMRSHDAAVVQADLGFDVTSMGGRHRDGRGIFLVPTDVSSWTYTRRHGGELHASEYDRALLLQDARRLRKALMRGDAYVYFNNDVGGFAPRDAALLATLLTEQDRSGTQVRGAASEAVPPFEAWAVATPGRDASEKPI